MRDESISLKTIFFHIACPVLGAPYLKRSGLPLAPVLAHLSGAGSTDVFKKFRKIKPQEVQAVQAYLARFGADVDHPYAIPTPGPNAVMLDECVPYTILPQVRELFGFSSHVAAEQMNMGDGANRGKQRVMDRMIYDFTAAHDFRVLMTRDSDFVHFAKNNKTDVEKGPSILFIPPSAIAPAKEMVLRYDADIRHLVATHQGGLFQMDDHGVRRLVL